MSEQLPDLKSLLPSRELPTAPLSGEGDSDSIDYSTALRREYGRLQASDKLWRNNPEYHHASNTQVHNGFVMDKFITDKTTNNDVVFDVLPSFQLYRSLQNPPSDIINPDGVDFPPEYNRSQSDSNLLLSRPHQPTRSLSVVSDTLSSVPSYDVASQTATSNSSSVGGSVYNYNQIGDDDNVNYFNDDLFDKNLIDNLHRLPQQINTGVEVEIHVTKDVPEVYQKPEAESMLKEYTSGDVVHGYVTVRNRTKKPIPFQAFYVTLEGAVSVIDTVNKKQILKKFLSMVDVSASWSLACISPSGNISYVPMAKDIDGATLGLRNDRILGPEATYKKFFTFKFPYNTLDTTCRHQQELHTLLPPSFGVNVIKKRGMYSQIEMNSVLNFGHLGKTGSPILTRDLSGRELSINYSINATLCGLKVTQNGMKKLAVIKESEYALRFIPFGFGVSLFSSKKSIESLKRLVEHSFKTAERSLKLLQEGKEDEVEVMDNQIKLEQLRIGSMSESSDANSASNFPLRNETFASPDFSKIETGLTYIQSDNSKGLLSKFKGGSGSSPTSANGFLAITTNLPKDGLPYISPSLIRKTNEAAKLTSLGFENLEGMKNVLSTNEKKKLAAVHIQFKFQPSDNFSTKSVTNNLPAISSISTKLLVLNVYSSGSIPIKLSADVCQPHLFSDLTKDFIAYESKLSELEWEFEKQGVQLKKYIASDIIADIKSMANMKNDSFLLPVFNHDLTKNEWICHEDGSYVQDLELNLEFKDQIRETLIPNFQTCVLARNYFIQVDFKFKNGKTACLRVPIRLRQFDGLS